MGGLVLTLLLAFALAQQAPAAPPSEGAAEQAPEAPQEAPDTTPETGPEEVVIYAELRIQQAREDLIDRAQSLGYTKVIERDGRTILRHELPWHGEIVLVDDGQVAVKRQPVRFEPPFAKDKPAAWLTCILFPLCIRPGGQLVSQRRFRGFEREAWEGIGDNVTNWNDRIADAATTAKVDELPPRLEALWEQGTPIDGQGAALATWEERRQALLVFWDSRTETEWGLSVRDAVAAFMRGVVQNSDHPYTAEEIATFNRGRASTHPLVLTPPGQ